MQVVDIQKTAAAFSLKVASQIFIRGEGISAMRTITVKTKPKPNTYYKTPTMRVEGGWVGVRTRPRVRAARATVGSLSHQYTVAGRPHRAGQWHTGTQQGSGSTTSPTPSGDGDQFFLRRNLPTS